MPYLSNQNHITEWYWTTGKARGWVKIMCETVHSGKFMSFNFYLFIFFYLSVIVQLVSEFIGIEIEDSLCPLWHFSFLITFSHTSKTKSLRRVSWAAASIKLNRNDWEVKKRNLFISFEVEKMHSLSRIFSWSNEMTFQDKNLIFHLKNPQFLRNSPTLVLKIITFYT